MSTHAGRASIAADNPGTGADLTSDSTVLTNGGTDGGIDDTISESQELRTLDEMTIQIKRWN